MKKKGRIGSTFADFLKEEGFYAEATARAMKRVIAYQLDQLMADQGNRNTTQSKVDKNTV